MFAIFGVAGLLVFILARPQEYFETLQRLPMLHLCSLGALGGLVLDIKLRRLEPHPTPIFKWVIAFMAWALITTVVEAPRVLIQNGILLATTFILFTTIAHGVQRIHTLRVVAAVVMGVALMLSVVCIHQAFQEHQCIIADAELPGEGTPDGRGCVMARDCYSDDSEPGAEYRCEKAGLFGTYTIEDRVRYRGELHDPNEVGMTICIFGASFLIAFANQRRKFGTIVFSAIGCAVVMYCVILTQSRGAIMVFAIVCGTYAVKRFGIAGMVAGGALAAPLLAFGGRSGASADESTQLRYEAWSTGIQMFKHSPIFGVGARQFAEHHFMTAHNSYVLTLSEMGLPGLVLFICVFYLSLKTLIRGVIDLEGIPEARPAQVWALALISSFAGLMFSINTLSFAYHPVLWILVGLGGAWVSAVRPHKPDFDVRISKREFLYIVLGCAFYAMIVLPIFVRLKGE